MNRFELFVVLIKLFLGSMQFITFKTLAQTKVINMDGVVAPFKRSFFVAFVLFGSVMMALIPYAYLKKKRGNEISSITVKSAARISISGTCDAVAQISTILGAANVPVSLLMILKGSRAVFSAALSIFLFKKNLKNYQWASIAICLGGLTIASLGSFFSKTTPANHLALGISLILIAEAFRSVRMVYDELMMHKYGYNPFMIIGLEGVYGTIIAVSALIAVNFISGSDVNGVVEYFQNTVYMIDHSTLLAILLGFLPVWVLSMYLSGIFVTKCMSAVYNAVLTVLGVAVVWAYEILIHYCVSTDYGNAWTSWSFMQLGGFALILASTLMYDATWKIPQIFSYDSPAQSMATISTTKAGKEEDDSTTVEEMRVNAQ